MTSTNSCQERWWQLNSSADRCLRKDREFLWTSRDADLLPTSVCEWEYCVWVWFLLDYTRSKSVGFSAQHRFGFRCLVSLGCTMGRTWNHWCRPYQLRVWRVETKKCAFPCGPDTTIIGSWRNKILSLVVTSEWQMKTYNLSASCKAPWTCRNTSPTRSRDTVVPFSAKPMACKNNKDLDRQILKRISHFPLLVYNRFFCLPGAIARCCSFTIQDANRKKFLNRSMNVQNNACSRHKHLLPSTSLSWCRPLRWWSEKLLLLCESEHWISLCSVNPRCTKFQGIPLVIVVIWGKTFFFPGLRQQHKLSLCDFGRRCYSVIDCVHGSMNTLHSRTLGSCVEGNLGCSLLTMSHPPPSHFQDQCQAWIQSFGKTYVGTRRGTAFTICPNIHSSAAPTEARMQHWTDSAQVHSAVKWGLRIRVERFVMKGNTPTHTISWRPFPSWFLSSVRKSRGT